MVLIKSASGQLRCMGPAQVRKTAGQGFCKSSGKMSRQRVQQMTGPCKTTEALLDRTFPACDITDEFFKNRKSALTPPVVDGFGHINTPSTPVQRRYHTRADQITDIGNRPVITKLDELILPDTVVTAS